MESGGIDQSLSDEQAISEIDASKSKLQRKNILEKSISAMQAGPKKYVQKLRQQGAENHT